MSIKAKIGMAAAATVLGAALVGGGTFALFTSSATNAGNTFTAGTVIITDTTGGPVASQAVNFSNLAPGDNGTVSMTVKNDGTLDEWVHINTAASGATSAGDLFGGATPLALTYDADVVKLAPGTSYTFDIGYEFPLAADNSYQGDSGTFSIVVDAVQARNNTNTTNDGPLSWN